MSDCPYIALYVRDFIADTAHLGNTELGLYFRLLLYYYQHRKPLPGDIEKVYRIAYALTPEERKMTEYVINEFFHVDHGQDGARHWVHRRAEREIKQAEDRITAARQRTAKARAARAEAIKLSSNKVCDKDCNRVSNSSEAEAEAEAELTIRRSVQVSNETCTCPQPPSDGPDEDHQKVNVKHAKNLLPPCPQKQIISLYHEILPMLPEVRTWNPTREALLRARWREQTTLGPMASLNAWQDFFEYIRDHCPWLVGKVKTTDGRRPFQANLEWLIRPTNFAKVIEGHYERR
jgi:uncharacterized protein YdaU (DUF1376 family)